MTIDNPVAYVEGKWDWACLRGCFGDTRIEPTDVDGLVERHGRFLLLEAKAHGAVIKWGQSILHDSLVAQPNWWVVTFWGDAATKTVGKIEVRLSSREAHTIDPASLKKLRSVVTRWYQWANTQPRAA